VAASLSTEVWDIRSLPVKPCLTRANLFHGVEIQPRNAGKRQIGLWPARMLYLELLELLTKIFFCFVCCVDFLCERRKVAFQLLASCNRRRSLLSFLLKLQLQVAQLADMINCKISIIRFQKEFLRFWRKTDEMAKTGRRDENIDFWRNLMKLPKFAICARIFDKFAFLQTKMAFLAAKFGGDLQKAY